MSISSVTQFAGVLRGQLNLQADAGNTDSVSRNSTSELLSKAVSSLDLSDAGYGTLLLKDKLHEQAYAYSVVTVKQEYLSSLNAQIQNVQHSKTLYYSVLLSLAVTSHLSIEISTCILPSPALSGIDP